MKIRPGLELANLTDVGCQRANNEDYYGYAEPDGDSEYARKGRLIVIADGVGGREGGEVASGIAVECVRAAYLASEAESSGEALIEALHAAHQSIRDFAQKHPELSGMGTTCIAAVVHDSKLTYVHVGDSRLYLIRWGAIQQLTRDQTATNRLIDEGLITEENAENHPDHGVLTAAVGIGENLPAEIPAHPICLAPSDVLVMCTDGLHDLVKDEEIAAAVNGNSPSDACRALIDLAKSRGGYDNITVQIVRFDGAGDSEGGAA